MAAISKHTAFGSRNVFQLLSLNRFAAKIFRSNSENAHKTPEVMDITDKEVLEFLNSLDKNAVKYLLVGGVATSFHGYIRTTQDLDLWIGPGPENMKRLIQALKDVGVPGAELLKPPLIAGYTEVRIGQSGFVADLMHNLKKFTEKDFGTCYERARLGDLEGVPIHVIHINDLIEEKTTTDRDKDRVDVKELNKIKNKLMS